MPISMRPYFNYFKEHLNNLPPNKIEEITIPNNENTNYFQIKILNWGKNLHYEIRRNRNVFAEFHVERPFDDELKRKLKEFCNNRTKINNNDEFEIRFNDQWQGRKGCRVYIETKTDPDPATDVKRKFEAMKILMESTYETINEHLNPHQNNNSTPSQQQAINPIPDHGGKNPISFPLNSILYGPPGTGKTYHVVPRALSIINKGVRPSTDRIKQVRDFITAQENSDGQICMVTFHQSYGYEEFVEGLRPVLSDSEESDPNGSDVRYHIQDGPFLKMCKRANKNRDKNYVIVIDEINRGNISKIFGELITLIEADKRMFMTDPDSPLPDSSLNGANGLSVTLPYSGDQFSVPPNLSIIGTMNTADRSLALLDTALRRRFDFVEMMPEPELLKGIEVKGIKLCKLLKTVNQRIEALYDREHTIGHAYFIGLNQLKNEKERFSELGNIFKNRIIPLLQEYFFDDWAKIRLVLGDNKKASQDLQFITTEEVSIESLFGRSEVDNFEWVESKTLYQISSTATSDPAAYVGIYQP